MASETELRQAAERPSQAPSSPSIALQATRAVALLLLTTAAASLLLWQLARHSMLGRLILANSVPSEERQGVLWGAALAMTLVLAAAAGLLLWRRQRAAALLETVARATLPLVPLSLVPTLYVREVWYERELAFLVLVGAIGLGLEQALQIALGPWSRGCKRLGVALRAAEPDGLLGRWRGLLGGRGRRFAQEAIRWLPVTLMLTAAFHYFFQISSFTLMSHWRLTTATADLGEFDNLFFNALHGHPFRAPCTDGDLNDWGSLKTHAEFLLYLLLPFYAIRPGAETLLVIQTGVVALTAIPVYLFTAGRLGRWWGLVLAVTYLLLPIVQRPNFYDFHFTPVGMLFVMWTLYFVDRVPTHTGPGALPPRRWERAALGVAFALALLSREDIAAGLIVLGLIVALSGHNLRLGLSMAGVAAVYFGLVKFWLMPAFGERHFDVLYVELFTPGQTGAQSVLETCFTNPLFVARTILTEPKLLYVLHLAVPLLFLWLRRPVLLLAALPASFFTLFVTSRPAHSESTFQYTYLWVPYVLAASVLAVQWFGRRSGAARRRTAAGISLVFTILTVSFQCGALLGSDWIRGGFGVKRLSMTERERNRLHDLQILVKEIPDDASVAAYEYLGPHISTRLVAQAVRCQDCAKAEYVLIDRLHRKLEADIVAGWLKSEEYGVVARQGDFSLLRLGADPADNEKELRRLRRKRR